ncbi:MAG: hypothetical protein K8F35_07865 [Dokdonella sp.]|nr:hypothetical protein [Dokdonella sp.]
MIIVQIFMRSSGHETADECSMPPDWHDAAPLASWRDGDGILREPPQG